jgi:DNA-directed RNA polymerase subunit M/transcription elongation factor TFIIS
MPRTRCPACGSILVQWLEETGKDSNVDYYRCGDCGHEWDVPKEDPVATPQHVTPPPAKSKSKKATSNQRRSS